MRRLACLISVAVLLLLSCSSEEPAGTGGKGAPETAKDSIGGQAPTSDAGAPEAEVPRLLRIVPERAHSGTTLELVAEGFDLSRAEVRWLRNGEPLAVGSELRLDTGEFNVTRADKIQAVAAIDGAEVVSGTVFIGNAPPRLKSVKLVPEDFRPGDVLGVEAEAEDPDRDAVTIEYEWTKNGEPAGDTAQIGVPLKRGDWFTIRVTPFDGEEYGLPVVLKRGLRNFPPMFSGSIKKNFDGKLFTYEVKASDPDGDTLTYAVSGPEGAKIESSTGAGSWEVPEDFEGEVPFTVTAADGHGGEARQAFKLTITAEK